MSGSFGALAGGKRGWWRCVTRLGRRFHVIALGALLLAACDEVRPTITAPSPTAIAVMPAPLAVTSAATAAPTAVPAPTPVPATATPPSPLPSATARSASVPPSPSPTSADPAQASVDAGNADLRAGNAAAAVHDYAIARLLDPHRSDITASLATAEAQVEQGEANRGGPTATPTPVVSLPTRLIIPAIGVNAPVEHVGLAADGGMDVPKKWADVAWFQDGPAPGQPGNATIDGHLDSTTAPAVFWRLGALAVGDRVLVVLADNQSIPFVVRADARYPYNQAPLGRIFGATSSINLNLITCGGVWDAFQKNYSERVVVYTSKA